ncbi:DUF4145 domain-containing protein [Pseudobacter ginsenosidimutans]|uniref:Uncharacterized protein DUF4145 n=1 Tax=Pseudobacter ginsenosidimutans TaxID=661488 RepID=A0A4Q7MFN9_9BACT|nr:DUF4145 domain-containing protein [Pseudobacter ginsenosidimutans]QEC45367.1 DUF4145 domain-containing protein [Pseudobacter ginsenosidimutans]RZS66891.1 uncharacterized protein DUF4145 [Pseudobacter ginsenosidimutans]
MVFECVKCDLTVKGELVAEYSYSLDDIFFEKTKYTILKCPQCFGPAIVKSEGELQRDGDYDWRRSQIFPQEEFHVNPAIPQKLRDALLESLKCYRGKSFTGTAVMCRRTLEGFCREKDINESNLLKGLQKLKENGEINDQLYEWADQLRLTGNEAAHNIDSVFTAEDAKNIVEFTIAILDFSYSFKDKFSNFKNRINR